MRYLIRLDGKLGTSDTLIREYASDRNALRFGHIHLRANNYASGQYVVETFPPAGSRVESRHVGYLYKMA